MRLLRYLFIVASVFAAMMACQKELNFESGTAVGSLKSSGTGECLPSIVMGTYKVDSLLTNANYIDVHVNITVAGTFVVKSDTVNGYSFYKEGTLGNLGDNVVRLYATGKPIAAGVNTFLIKFGTSVCAINVTVTGAGGGGTGAAVYTLGGSPLNCTGALANGTYVAGTVLNATNTLTVSVNVTTVGTFAIGVLPVNGIAFGASGTFTTTGVQNVTLNGTGTPAAAGSFNLTVTTGTNTCILPLTVTGTGPVAVFTMGGSPGSCTGVLANGTYTVGTALTAANTVTLDVNVTTLGAYNISTTTVNGIQFAVNGSFTTLGPQTVTLTGTGTPTAAGANNYPATGLTSTCTFSITANTSGSAAVYTLGGAPGNCTGALLGGTYTAGTALTGANTVVLNVNVSTTGTYSITTAAVNGIQFAGTGTFSATGPQTVTLTGSGTPAAAGTNNYTANAGGTNTCIFSVPVNPAPNQDYFPLTQNSWWSYDSDYTSPDSLYKKNTTLVTFSGNSYRRIEINANTVPYDTVFYRKSGNDYYQRIMVDSFTNFYLDVLQFGEMIFLKENAPAGTNWNSAVFSGTVVGTPVLLRYNYNIVSVTTTITVNGVTYNNVIKVDSKSQYSIDAGVTYVDNVATESWYAKGVGLIKFHQYLISNPAQSLVDDLRYYQVF